MARLYLAGGVTTMRTGGNVNGVMDIKMKSEIEAGRQAGPAIDATAPYLNGQNSFLQMHGLKDPEGAAIHPTTGELWLVDHGPQGGDEINIIEPGKNYGWGIMEGTHCYKPKSNCNQSGLTLPVAEYDHETGACSVTGGYVYRGPTQRALVGLYVFADYCSGRIWTLPANGTAVNSRETLRADTAHNITSFGKSESGELYLVTAAGEVFKVLAS